MTLEQRLQALEGQVQALSEAQPPSADGFTETNYEVNSDNTVEELGTEIYEEAGEPPEEFGDEGDLWIDESTGDIYRKGPTKWVLVGGGFRQLASPQHIEASLLPGEAAPAFFTASPSGQPRSLLSFSFGFNTKAFVTAVNKRRYSGIECTLGTSGGGGNFPTYSEATRTDIPAAPNPASIVIPEKESAATASVFNHFLLVGAPGATNKMRSEQVYAGAETQLMQLAVVLPTNVVACWAVCLRRTANLPIARSDLLIAQHAGVYKEGAGNEGLAEIQVVQSPVAGEHVFSWEFAEAAPGGAEIGCIIICYLEQK